MSTYAPVPAFAARDRHPRMLVFILAGHALLLGAVMTARMDLPAAWVPTVTDVTLVPEPPVPPEQPQPQPPKPQQPSNERIQRVPVIVPTPAPETPSLDTSPQPTPIDPGPVIGAGSGNATPAPIQPVRVGPRFATPQSRIKPPYPPQKLRTEEQAALRLRLSIDARGRVTAVEPVGTPDRAFLEAARRHILAYWRYEPATEDGKAVASSTVITLRFEID